MKHTIFLVFILFTFAGNGFSQQVKPPDRDSVRMAVIEQKLAQVAVLDPTYLSEVDVSVGKIALPDLLRNVAKVSSVSLSVKGAEKTMVTVNFARARIIDLLLFLCKEYNMDIAVVRNIVSIFPAAPEPEKPREPKIEYTLSSRTLSYDLNGDLLIDVSKKIAALTGTNIVVPQPMYTRQVSGFVQSMPFEEAVRTLASVNGLDAERDESGVWNLAELPADAKGGRTPQPPAYSRKRQYPPNQLSVDSLGMITAKIGKGNVQDIILDLCDQMKLNYFFLAPIQQQTGIFVERVDLSTLLALLMSGTNYTYYKVDDIYIFGTSGKEAKMTAVEVVPLRFRSVDKIDELIPMALKEGLQIQQFADLNSLIVCGEQKQVARVESFVRSIDKSVPLVTIEIMIVDVTKSNIMEAGINAGLGESPVKKTTGKISPGVDMNLNAASVNNLIRSFNGFGSVNLGRVTPDFYLSLKFLEENGTIQLRSTPKLSTLNGHEASLKSGQTRYYKEIQNNITSGLSPIQSESFVWKNIDANLDITIVPFVTENDHITLDIEIEQTEFTGREEKDAPPGTATRKFKSQIRVRNEDMVLLGGIDRNSTEKNTTGLPFIARVPILKWLFGSTTDNQTDQKLNIFIKPTIIP